jgi:archaellum biogenesis ATPase FlaH
MFDVRKTWDAQADAVRKLAAAGVCHEDISRLTDIPVIKIQHTIDSQYRTTPEELERLKENHWQEWFVEGSSVSERKIPERKVLLSDAETGAAVLYASSINMLWAFRGQGKSIVANALMKTLVTGSDWLRFASSGGHGVLLVDGELPAKQLQERLDEFAGSGSFRVLSPEFMTSPEDFPNLSEPEGQYAFLSRLEYAEEQGAKIDVLIFDTLTRCFRIDTNDADAWLNVNDFLIALRAKGYCVLLIHHAGKNQTQRGRTDADDNLDVSIKLGAPYGWQAGDGLAFKWVYEKVRHGGKLPDFEASYTDGEWRIETDDRLAEVEAMTQAGKSSRAIATALDMTQSAVSRMQRRIAADALEVLNSKGVGRDETGGGRRKREVSQP